jgi:hypothetical protein
MIDVIAALALLGAIQSSPEAKPYQPNARCLAAVLAARNETLDILDARSLGRANDTYTAMWDDTAALILAENEVVRTATRYLQTVQGLVDEGTVPAGSVEVERDRFLNDLARAEGSAVAERRLRFPACQWPSGSSDSVRNRVAAIRID